MKNWGGERRNRAEQEEKFVIWQHGDAFIRAAITAESSRRTWYEKQQERQKYKAEDVFVDSNSSLLAGLLQVYFVLNDWLPYFVLDKFVCV